MATLVQGHFVSLDLVAMILRDAPLGEPDVIKSGVGRWLQEFFSAVRFEQRHEFLDRVLLGETGIEGWLSQCATLPAPQRASRYGLSLYLLSTIGLREAAVTQQCVEQRDHVLRETATIFGLSRDAVRRDVNRMMSARRGIRARWEARHSPADDEKIDEKGRTYQ